MTKQLSENEQAVLSRYSDGAQAREEALCCPVSFDGKLLSVLPDEILERDYGCGDPTPFVRRGDVVLDLGCGAGKVCWIAAQITGRDGRVIGVDMNEDMLALAHKHHGAIAENVGFDNVTFHRGMIQDLRPILADGSIDIVLSNCVLNLVRHEDKEQLFSEIYRVVRNGGRVAISDIVADEDVPLEMQRDPDLWSGCISGAYREDRFIRAFEEAGFHGIEIFSRSTEPWRTVNGIEFRAVTVRAFRGKEGPRLERKQALIYRGPMSKICDDDGHVFHRGEPMAVCDKTFNLLQREPYEGMFIPVEPREAIPLGQAGPFEPNDPARRDPKETKGKDFSVTTAPAKDCCEPDTTCG